MTEEERARIRALPAAEQAAAIMEIVKRDPGRDARGLRRQPFYPPVAEALVWRMPREGMEELAADLYAQVTWGSEPHPSQVSKAELAEWERVRPTWERAVVSFMHGLDRMGFVFIEDDSGEKR